MQGQEEQWLLSPDSQLTGVVEEVVSGLERWKEIAFYLMVSANFYKKGFLKFQTTSEFMFVRDVG